MPPVCDTAFSGTGHRAGVHSSRSGRGRACRGLNGPARRAGRTNWESRHLGGTNWESRHLGGANWESRHLGGGDRPLGRLLVDDAELEDADEPGHDHDDDGEVSGSWLVASG